MQHFEMHPDDEKFFSLTWHRGKLLFATGFFFGGSGLSGAALLQWNQDAAQPPEEHRTKLLGAANADDTIYVGHLQRRVGSWWPHWEHAEAALRHSLLLVRQVDGKAEPSSAVSFAHGSKASALPLLGAKVETAEEQKLEPQPPQRYTVVLTSPAGDVETLGFPSVEMQQQWVQALRAEAAGKHASYHRRLVDVAYPPTWQQPFERTQIVPLERGSAEYKRVERLALSQQLKGKHTYVKGKLIIRSISRVQSPHVWEQYAMRRAVIASENEGNPEERLLWHGTCVPHVITKEGFDPRVANLEGMFGAGVYFADKSTKSLRYAGACKPGDTGTLFLCRVSLGRPMLKRLPKANLRRPPDPLPFFGWEHAEMWWQGKKFHSVFAQAGAAPAFLLMNEYIVYHTNQGCASGGLDPIPSLPSPLPYPDLLISLLLSSRPFLSAVCPAALHPRRAIAAPTNLPSHPLAPTLASAVPEYVLQFELK